MFSLRKSHCYYLYSLDCMVGTLFVGGMERQDQESGKMLFDDSDLNSRTFVGYPSYRNFGRLHATTTTLFAVYIQQHLYLSNIQYSSMQSQAFLLSPLVSRDSMLLMSYKNEFDSLCCLMPHLHAFVSAELYTKNFRTDIEI